MTKHEPRQRNNEHMHNDYVVHFHIFVERENRYAFVRKISHSIFHTRAAMLHQPHNVTGVPVFYKSFSQNSCFAKIRFPLKSVSPKDFLQTIGFLSPTHGFALPMRGVHVNGSFSTRMAFCCKTGLLQPKQLSSTKIIFHNDRYSLARIGFFCKDRISSAKIGVLLPGLWSDPLILC